MPGDHALESPPGHAGPGPGTAATRAARKRAAEDNDAQASLRKRMAGPSSGKAGLSKDQEEINRKIYEASRGSKFFENERAKDAETTQRINVLLAKRDDALSRVAVDSPEWRAIGKKVELRLAELEATRDLSRQICHVDADQFYAAVELKRDPSLKGKAFGVGTGVLTTASYEARLKGCRSGQAVFVAKALCPELITVPNNFAAYVEASGQVMEILGSYDENLQPASLDEAYLDITDYCTQHQMTAEQVVTQLRNEVQEETGLTVSVGIGANKTLAKICSDRNKPNGQYAVAHDRQTIMNFMHDLPVRKIPGIGRVTERILSAVNVQTCGDIWEHRHELSLTFGNSLDQLLSAYLGLGSTTVRPNDRRERKSVGRETTFRPTQDLEKMQAELRGCADQVEKDLERNHFKGRTVTLVAKKDTFQRFTRAKSGTAFLHKADDLFQVTLGLLLAEIAELERSKPGTKLTLRLIGVRVTHLKDLQPPDNQIKKLFEAAGSKGSSSGRSLDQGFDDDLREAMRLSLLAADSAGAVDATDAGPQGEDSVGRTDAAEAQTAAPSSSKLTTTPPKKKSPERGAPPVTASSFSPPRPKKPQRLSGLQFSHSSEPGTSTTPKSAMVPEAVSTKLGAAIPHSSPCPICQAPLAYWSNVELNAQIDACLDGRGHGTAPSQPITGERPAPTASVSATLSASAPPPAAAGRHRQGGSTEQASEPRNKASQRAKSSKATPKAKLSREGGPLDMWLRTERQ